MIVLPKMLEIRKTKFGQGFELFWLFYLRSCLKCRKLWCGEPPSNETVPIIIMLWLTSDIFFVWRKSSSVIHDSSFHTLKAAKIQQNEWVDLILTFLGVNINCVHFWEVSDISQRESLSRCLVDEKRSPLLSLLALSS